MRPNRAKVSYLPLKRDRQTGTPIPLNATDAMLSLPPLDSPLPKDEGWVVEEDNYHVVYAVNLSMLDPLTLFCPDSNPGDGVLWLVFVRASITRLQLLKWFLSLSDGPDSSLEPGVQLIPIRAFRIEPIHPLEGCILSLDGESVEFGAVQGQLLPQVAKLLANRK